jgi:hypothetical protein
MYVLEQVAAGNMPSTYNDFVTIEVKGQKGTEVKFEAAPHGLRIGHNNDYIEVPLDGPHAMAAAEILGYTLPTTWMVEAIYQQAKKNKGKVKFVAAPEIAKALGIKNWNPNRPDGWWQQSPQFIRMRNMLLKAWRADPKHPITDGQLEAGYFKEICQPKKSQGGRPGFVGNLLSGRDNAGESVRLEFYGGYNDQGGLVQGVSGGIHEGKYFDYSHGVRFVKPTLTVNGKPMTFEEFHSSAQFATEFRFDKATLAPYPYDPELAKFVASNK